MFFLVWQMQFLLHCWAIKSGYVSFEATWASKVYTLKKKTTTLQWQYVSPSLSKVCSILSENLRAALFCLIPANFQLQQEVKTGRWWKEAASKGLNMLFSGDLWSFWLIDHVMLLDWRPGWKTKMFKLQFRTTLRFTPVTLKTNYLVSLNTSIWECFSPSMLNSGIKSLFHYEGGLRPNAIQVLSKYWCLSGVLCSSTEPFDPHSTFIMEWGKCNYWVYAVKVTQIQTLHHRHGS